MSLQKVRLALAATMMTGALATGAGVLAQAVQRDSPKSEPDKLAVVDARSAVSVNQALAKEQYELASRAMVDLRTLATNGDLNFTDPAFAVWGRRKLEALRASGADKAQVVAALEEQLASLRGMEESVAKAAKKAHVTQVDAMDMTYRRIEVEVLLNLEKAR